MQRVESAIATTTTTLRLSACFESFAFEIVVPTFEFHQEYLILVQDCGITHSLKQTLIFLFFPSNSMCFLHLALALLVTFSPPSLSLSHPRSHSTLHSNNISTLLSI